MHGEGSRRNFVDKSFRAVNRSLIAKYVALIDLKPTSFSGKLLQAALKTGSFGFAEYNFINPQYIVGYYFVSHAMHTLVDSAHMTVPEAMRFLIKHPPTKLIDLKSPEDYVTQLLKKPIPRITSLRRLKRQQVDSIHPIN